MPTNLKTIPQNVAQKEAIANENFIATSAAAKFSQRSTSAPGLYFYYYGGTEIANDGTIVNLNDGGILCTASATNYIYFNPTTKVIERNTTGFIAGVKPICQVGTDSTQITSYSDRRALAMQTFGTVIPISTSTIEQQKWGDLNINNLNGLTINLTLKMGRFWNQGKTVSEESVININDYTTNQNLSANSVYYIYFRYTNNTISFILSSNLLNNLFVSENAQLLYILTTNATTVSKIEDCRNRNLNIRNKTLLMSTAITTSRTYTFTNSLLSKFNADQYVLSAVSSRFPSFLRPHLSLMCLIAEHGYAVGEECDFGTGNMLSEALAKNWKLNSSTGSIVCNFGTNIYVYSMTNSTWQMITNANWALVVKVPLDYH